MQQETLHNPTNSVEPIESGDSLNIDIIFQCEVKIYDDDGDFDHFEYQSQTFSIPVENISTPHATQDAPQFIQQLVHTKTRPDGSGYTDIPISTLQAIFDTENTDRTINAFIRKRQEDIVRVAEKERREASGEKMEFDSNSERYNHVLSRILELSTLQHIPLDQLRTKFKGVFGKFRFASYDLNTSDDHQEQVMNRHETQDLLIQLKELRANQAQPDTEKLAFSLTILHSHTLDESSALEFRTKIYDNQVHISELNHDEIVYILACELELLSRPNDGVNEKDAMIQLANRLHEQGYWFVHIKQATEHDTDQYHGAIREIRDEQGNVIDAAFDPCPDHTPQTDADLKIESEHAQKEIQEMIEVEHQQFEKEQLHEKLDQVGLDHQNEILGVPPDYFDRKNPLDDLSDTNQEKRDITTKDDDSQNTVRKKGYTWNVASRQFNVFITPRNAIDTGISHSLQTATRELLPLQLNMDTENFSALPASITSKLRRGTKRILGSQHNTETDGTKYIAEPLTEAFDRAREYSENITPVVGIHNTREQNFQPKTSKTEHSSQSNKVVRIVFTQTGISHGQRLLSNADVSFHDGISTNVIFVPLPEIGIQSRNAAMEANNSRDSSSEPFKKSPKRFPIEGKQNERLTTRETSMTQTIPASRIVDALIHLDQEQGTVKEQTVSVTHEEPHVLVKEVQSRSRKNTVQEIERSEVVVKPKTETADANTEIVSSRGPSITRLVQRRINQADKKEEVIVVRQSAQINSVAQQEIGTNEHQLVTSTTAQQVPILDIPVAKRQRTKTVRRNAMTNSASVAKDFYSLDIVSIQQAFVEELRNARRVAV